MIQKGKMGAAGDGVSMDISVGKNSPHTAITENLQAMSRKMQELLQQTRDKQAECCMLEIDLAELFDPEFMEERMSTQEKCESCKRRLDEETEDWDELMTYMKMDLDEMPTDENGNPKLPWKTAEGHTEEDKDGKDEESGEEENPYAEIDRIVEDFHKEMSKYVDFAKIEKEEQSVADTKAKHQGVPDADKKENQDEKDADAEEVTEEKQDEAGDGNQATGEDGAKEASTELVEDKAKE